MTTPVAAPRIAPGGRREIGVVSWAIAGASGLVTGTTTPNLFLTLGRHRRLFHGWLRFAAALMPRGRLPRRETELVILRVAHRRNCTYEFEHHRHLGARAGLTNSDIDRVVADAPVAAGTGGWTGREAAILGAVDQLLDHRDLDDEAWGRLAGHLDERGLIELVLLVGHYDMLATAIGTLRIVPDRPRRG